MKLELARHVPITKSSLLTNTAARMLFVQQTRKLIKMVHVKYAHTWLCPRIKNHVSTQIANLQNKFMKTEHAEIVHLTRNFQKIKGHALNLLVSKHN